MIVALLILQSAPAKIPLPTDTAPHVETGLRPQSCDVADGDEIVICGRRADQPYRLPRLDKDRFERERGPAKAEFEIAGGLKGAAEVESAEVGNGQTSKRAMFRLKLPF